MPGQTHACALTDTNGKLLPLAPCATNINASFHKPTWTLAIDHDLWDGTLVYATMRCGYRSGAINSAAIQPAAIVAKPENVTDYEVGMKSDLDAAGHAGPHQSGRLFLRLSQHPDPGDAAQCHPRHRPPAAGPAPRRPSTPTPASTPPTTM